MISYHQCGLTGPSTEGLNRMKTWRKSESFYLLELWSFIFSSVLDTGAHISPTSNSNQDLQSHPCLPAIFRPSDSPSIAWLTLWFLQIAVAGCITSWPLELHIQLLLFSFSCKPLNNTKIKTQKIWAFLYNVHWIFIPFPPSAILCFFVNNHLCDLNYL